VASGINNAVARAAGLLAVAVLGVVMLHVFSIELKQRLSLINLPEATRLAIYDQRIKLAGLNVNEGLAENALDNAGMRQALSQAVKESFVKGFRVVVLIAAAIALAGSVTSFLLIENRKP
jgi:hypothetical protein